jgi:type IV pilus assembly protein PilA
MTKKVSVKRGFTLLEILLVVGIIAILAGIVILAINPTKQLGDARNAQRRSDVLTILNAIYQYSIDQNGVIPATITSTATCGLGSGIEVGNGATGASYVDLYTTLINGAASSTYLVAIPHDPLATSSADNYGSGYGVVKTSSGRVTVCAPLAESNVTISVTR